MACLYGAPGLLALALTGTVQLLSYRQREAFQLDLVQVRSQLADLGKLTRPEMRVIAVMAAAVLFWITDSLHGLHPGWIALIAALSFAVPPHALLDAKSWSGVNLGTLFFLCAALAIGSIGKAVGMNVWLAELIIPQQTVRSPYLFALLAMLICMALHMALGSALAVLGIACPAIISFGTAAGIAPLAAALIAYTSVSLHWLLPFHHMNLLVGCGDDGGGFEKRMCCVLAFHRQQWSRPLFYLKCSGGISSGSFNRLPGFNWLKSGAFICKSVCLISGLCQRRL